MYIYALAFSDWLIKYALVLPSSRNQVPLANMHPIINQSSQLLKDKSDNNPSFKPAEINKEAFYSGPFFKTKFLLYENQIQKFVFQKKGNY